MTDWNTYREIEDLLFREAHLLDERRFHEWLDLFADDAIYILPLRENLQGDVPPAGHPVIKDDRDMLRARVHALHSGHTNAEAPPSMTCHMVANVVVDEVSQGEAAVRSAFMIRQVRKQHDEAWWTGRRHDALRLESGGWKIFRREVLLDATVLPRGIHIFF